jgi:hypothetical protein
MKIYLFAHGRCGTPQASEHKILCNNLEKCEKMLCDVMRQHLQQFGKMWSCAILQGGITKVF